jgi:hypothetical protein
MRFWWLALPCPLLAGCLGFAYPDISQTPKVAVSAEGVHAFRVNSEITMSGPWMTGPVECSVSVAEISVVKAAVVPQRDAYLAYYYLLFPFNGSRSRTLEVLLYRPGYQVVAIPARPWWQGAGSDRPEEVAWKEAPDLPARMEAVDQIAAGGTRGTASKDVLHFVAGEYRRLADSQAAGSAEMAAQREKLLSLARKYESLADARDP